MALSKAEARPREIEYFILKSGDLNQLISGIPEDYEIIGPVETKWAVNLDHIESTTDLAMGLKSEEHSGSYRLMKDPAKLGLDKARPMNSPKSFTHRPREVLYKTRKNSAGGYEYETPAEMPAKTAFFGLRACDISGMYVLDRTFNREFRDPGYAHRRENTIIIGVNCLASGNNCFCSTFNTGPGLKGGFDIGLSDFGDELLVEIATNTGAKILADADLKPANGRLTALKRTGIETARQSQKKAFDLNKALDSLNENYEHPYWQEPSARCLSCANCINVCPTCYCYQIVDQGSLNQSEWTRTRTWDACQHLEFAAIHGGNFRPKRVDRVRQWVNHKLNWTIEQYGCAGCVGCGRCITWCPTAIDITEPVRRLGGRNIGLV